MWYNTSTAWQTPRTCLNVPSLLSSVPLICGRRRTIVHSPRILHEIPSLASYLPGWRRSVFPFGTGTAGRRISWVFILFVVPRREQYEGGGRGLVASENGCIVSQQWAEEGRREHCYSPE